MPLRSTLKQPDRYMPAKTSLASLSDGTPPEQLTTRSPNTTAPNVLATQGQRGLSLFCAFMMPPVVASGLSVRPVWTSAWLCSRSCR